ncbi:MAG: calcium-binding protein [Nitrospirae bacterium]|nr:calcium-binding protein [Nitrospirota bacterium]MCL5421920.1 calcium-binding protein [Nitrospirota bacterium]
MAKTKSKQNKVREERIEMEIIVDAYGPEEQAMGWYYYLEEKLKFPFTALCSSKRAISPLRIKDEVDVIGMAPEEECEREMFVMIRWEKDGLAVPLSQLTPIKSVNEQTKQAVEDWHYWVQMGYQFG